MKKFLASLTTSLALVTLQAGTAVASLGCKATLDCIWIAGVPLGCVTKVSCTAN